MKALRSIVVALLFAVSSFSCGYVNPIVERSTTPKTQLQPGQVSLSYTKIRQLQNATARFEVYKADGNLSWIGTAWSFYQGEHHSVWMTCRHVAKGCGDNAKIVYRNSAGQLVAGSVLNVVLREEPEHEDMAVFMSDARPANTLKLASEEYEAQLRAYYVTSEDLKTKTPILMASAGHIGWAYPSVVTVGAFIGYDDLGMRSTVGGWYGVSGSAIVDLGNMTVVGMRYRFADYIRTNDIADVPISTIREFLSTVEGLED